MDVHPLDPERCYLALRARDARFDGCEAMQAGFGQCDLSGASFFRAHLDDASPAIVGDSEVS